jgi:hypothetical protein
LIDFGLLVLEKKIFSNIAVYFYSFAIISPWRRAIPFVWRNLNSTKDTLYQVWWNLACWFWKRIKKKFSVLLLFCYYLPLKKGYPLRLKKLKSPSLKDNLYQVWWKVVQWFWRRSRKCKSLQTDRHTDRRTPDNGRSEKLTWAFSSGELKMRWSLRSKYKFYRQSLLRDLRQRSISLPFSIRTNPLL